MHEQVYSLPNIELADRKARRHKSVRWGILKHDKHREKENLKLAETLRNLTYKTSKYSTFKIYEPKERLIFRLPYYPDRITHHAIMNIMEPIWVNIFIKHTYSCIKDYSKYFRVHCVYKHKSYYFESKNKQLFYSIHRYSLPVNFKITPYVRPKKNRNKPATRTD